MKSDQTTQVISVTVLKISWDRDFIASLGNMFQCWKTYITYIESLIVGCCCLFVCMFVLVLCVMLKQTNVTTTQKKLKNKQTKNPINLGVVFQSQLTDMYMFTM